jgi:hypothetical protein
MKFVDHFLGMSPEQHYGFDIATTAPTFEASGLKLVA